MCLFSAICRATGISKETTSENDFCSRQGRPSAGHSTIWGSVYSRQSILERSLPFLGSIFPPHLAIAQSLVRSSDDIGISSNSSILLNRVQFQKIETLLMDLSMFCMAWYFSCKLSFQPIGNTIKFSNKGVEKLQNINYVYSMEKANIKVKPMYRCPDLRLSTNLSEMIHTVKPFFSLLSTMLYFLKLLSIWGVQYFVLQIWLASWLC